jgi:hypothetical protein
MSRWVIPFTLLIFTAFPTWAADVLFIEVHQNGRPIQLEPGGRFFHVAIRYKGQWLQAHPHGGVSLVDDIRHYGDRFVMLSNPSVPEPADDYVRRWLGKPFDFTYNWFNEKANYCTRLAAEALGVPPQPMSFAADVWKRHFVRPEGEPGLSPDKLYAELLKRGFTPSCEDLL